MTKPPPVTIAEADVMIDHVGSLGTRRGVSYVIARAVHRLFTSDAQGQGWSQRAGEHIGKLRDEHFFLKPDADVIVAEPPGPRCVWHTLSGNNVNLVLAQALDSSGIEIITCDDFSITVSVLVGLEQAHGQFGEHDRGRVSGKGWAGNR